MLVEAGKFIKDVTFLAGDFILHEDETLVAMEDLREFIVLLLTGFFKFLLAHSIHGIVEVLLHMEVVENDEGILRIRFGGCQKPSGPVTGNGLDRLAVLGAYGAVKLVQTPPCRGRCGSRSPCASLYQRHW